MVRCIKFVCHRNLPWIKPIIISGISFDQTYILISGISIFLCTHCVVICIGNIKFYNYYVLKYIIVCTMTLKVLDPDRKDFLVINVLIKFIKEAVSKHSQQ